MIRTYTELCSFKTFEERFEYLELGGTVGEETFGHDRYLNQMFYSSDLWKSVRRNIILRDNGFDLGVDGYEIRGLITVHHINPITIEDIVNHSSILIDPENLITTAFATTHKAIHYGNRDILPKDFVERTPFDTCPWKKGML